MNWCKEHFGNAGLQSGLFLLLIVAVVGDFVGAELKRARLSRSAMAENVWNPQLDSFSEPSVATAVLKAEAERLWAAFVECRELEWTPASALEALRESERSGGERRVPAAGKTSPRRALIIKSMEQFRGEIHALALDLDQKLLTAYFESNRYQDFLDCYRQILRMDPGSLPAAVWAQCALDCAQRCDRTDEMMRALEAAIEAQANQKTAARLREMLAQWRGEHQVASATASR